MIFVPIIKPVGGKCNINCSYCYYRQKVKQTCKEKIMSDVVLKQLIDQVCATQKVVEFIWHGGEPLIAGIDFYKKVIKLQSFWAEKGINIYNSIQTNGTLINEEWIKFFKKNNFTVSVSIDGPEEFHNKTRVYFDDKGTHKKVVQNIRLLKKENLLSGIICCVGKHNSQYAKEIFDFFVKEEIQEIKFLQVQGREECGELLKDSVDPIEFADFLLKILNYWVKLDDPSINIVEIESIINLMLGKQTKDCMFLGECHKYFTVYPNGETYGCDSLPKVEELYFGNISDGLKKIANSKNFNCFKKRLIEIQSECQKCKWFNICHAGCLQDYYPDIFNLQTKNLFCPGLKKIYIKINSTLKKYNML